MRCHCQRLLACSTIVGLAMPGIQVCLLMCLVLSHNLPPSQAVQQWHQVSERPAAHPARCNLDAIVLISLGSTCAHKVLAGDCLQLPAPAG